jgi:hypothetical protein
MSAPQMLTFVHRFSRSVTCEMTVRDEPPESGMALSCEHQWSGRPKPKHVSAYRHWTLHTTQFLAERWQKRILYGLRIARNRTELWAFEPGSTPKLLKILNCGIS